MPIDRRLRIAIALCGAVLIAACGKLGGSAEVSRAQGPAPPNILLIVTDDQPTGTTKRMRQLSNDAGLRQDSARTTTTTRSAARPGRRC